jgi:hypothetical protein
MAHATEMKRFCRPSSQRDAIILRHAFGVTDLTDFPRELRYISLKFNKSSCADAPRHGKNLSNQWEQINAS